MPSKSRGLRASTGCFTCRKRRVKCDETHPRCRNCTRVSRDCEYPSPSATKTAQRPRALSARTIDSLPNVENALSIPEALPSNLNPAESVDATQSWVPFSVEAPPDDGFFLDDSLFAFGDALTPSFGPVEWYDLLAEDAISNMQGQQPSNRWNFDLASLSRRQTPRQSVAPEDLNNEEGQPVDSEAQLRPWKSETRIELNEEELVLFEHYINVVAPILDLFDPLRHFASIVPHLALHNVGLLKSILAVGARHMTLDQPQGQDDPDSPFSIRSVPSASKFAEKYYFETLQYLSQNLLYQTYTISRELHVTALLISTYEMFGTAGVSNHSAWDRHLRGTFWIQRATDISGESHDSLKRAVWFAWLRQDIWAAFRTGRPALTIHQPTKAMGDLTPDELATRIIYITAKCVQFAAAPKQGDIAGYIEAGATLMRMLDAWKRCLPSSYEPITVRSSTTPPSALAPIWIHPPAHAAAVQMYHFSRIVIVLNQPSTGGLSAYQTRLKTLRESTGVICGIAVAAQAQNLPSAFVSFQAVYASALCADTQDRQAEILDVLEGVLRVSKFPSRAILSDLVAVWSGGS